MTAEATRILKENIQAGTGTKANIGCPAGGKTGTTDEFNDAWFVGFTPRLATATWVGYPNAQIQMKTEYHGGSVAGGTFPAEIWHDYMMKVKGKFCGDFKPPTEPFHATPFFGKYSRSGGSGTGEYDRRARPVRTRRRRPHARRDDAGRRTPANEGRKRERQRQRKRERELRPRPLRVTSAGRHRPRPPTRAGPKRPPVDRRRTPGINRRRRPSIGRFQHAGRQCPAAPPRA